MGILMPNNLRSLMKLKTFFLFLLTAALLLTSEADARTRIKPAQRRGRIIYTNNIKGRGIAVLLGGYRGKYIRHYALPFVKYRVTSMKTTAAIQQISVKDEPIEMETDSVETVEEEQISPPPLHVNFVGYSDIIINKQDIEPQLKEIAQYLNESRGTTAVLSGNTGLEYEDGRPLGSGENVMVYPAALNGRACTTRELMLARANAIRTILISEYKIPAQRIEIAPGEQKVGAEFRTVGVEYKGQRTVTRHITRSAAPVHAVESK